jgi:hypothetical protein
VLEDEEVEPPIQFDDVNDDYEDGYGGRGPAFTPPTRPRTGKAALPLKRDRVRTPPPNPPARFSRAALIRWLGWLTPVSV